MSLYSWKAVLRFSACRPTSDQRCQLISKVSNVTLLMLLWKPIPADWNCLCWPALHMLTGSFHRLLLGTATSPTVERSYTKGQCTRLTLLLLLGTAVSAIWMVKQMGNEQTSKQGS